MCGLFWLLRREKHRDNSTIFTCTALRIAFSTGRICGFHRGVGDLGRRRGRGWGRNRMEGRNVRSHVNDYQFGFDDPHACPVLLVERREAVVVAPSLYTRWVIRIHAMLTATEWR